MNLKKINKVLFYTLLVFALAVYSVYPTSGAKYIKENDTVIIYGFDIEQIYEGDFTISRESTTTYEHLDLTFSFDRSEDANVEYRIDVGKCNITKVSTKGTLSADNDMITYNTEGTDTIIVHYSCAVEDVTGTNNGYEVLQSYPKVYEKYINESDEYLYAKGTYVISVDNFNELYPKPEDGIVSEHLRLVVPNDVSDKYSQVENWLKEHVANYGSEYLDAVLIYFRAKYNVDNITTDQALVGLTISYDVDANNYIYELDENFVGYARTDYSMSPYTMYFSAPLTQENEEKINSIFEYYVNTYLYPDSEESSTKLIDYVSKNGGIYSALSQDNQIPGITLLDSGDGIKISNKILVIIDALESAPMYVKHSSSMISEIEILLKSYDFITDDVFNNIIGQDMNLGNLFLKTGEAFDEYYILTHDDLANPIMFHIYSPYVADDESTHYNYFSAVELIDEASIVLEIDDLDKFKTTFDSIYVLFGYTADYSAFDITTGGDIVVTSETDATDVRTVKVEINDNKKVFTLDIE